MLSTVVMVSVGGIVLIVVQATVGQLIKRQSLTSALAAE
jgi:hypothetical protein